MNATNRLNLLLNDPSLLNNRINQETSIQPITRLTLSERDSHPSSILPSMIATTVPLPPRRDSSSMKHHHHRRRRYPLDHTSKEQQQQTYQPLLNSSTLDDLFRALTLECEQYLAATPSYQNKTYGKMIAQPSPNKGASVESNDEDYENLHPLKMSPTPIITTNASPLKTSIQVLSPIKRHVVSITVSSKMTTPTKPPSITTKSIPTTTTTTVIPSIPANRHSSGEDSINNSSSSTNRKHRRRRTRKQFPSSTGTRSSSSSNERKKTKAEKKSMMSKRSCSTDHRYQRLKTCYDNHFVSPPSSSSPQKQTSRRPVRRDISLQHPRSNTERIRDNYSSPLSALLTSTKPASDFFDNSHQRQQQQQRRSRLESVNQKSSALLDRMHQHFYRPSSTQNNNNNNNNNSNKNNILTHRIPSYPVY